MTSHVQDDHRWAERLADVCSRLDLDGIRFTIEQAITEARFWERRQAMQERDALREALEQAAIRAALTRLAGEVEQWKCNSRENKLIAEGLAGEVERLREALERIANYSGTYVGGTIFMTEVARAALEAKP